MYDFCLTIPYAALLALGGLAGYISKGSSASLASGLGSASILGLLGYISLQRYHKGQLCRPATFGSLVVSAVLTYVMTLRAQRKFMPAGVVAVVSAAMLIFYCWNLLLFRPNFKRSAA